MYPKRVMVKKMSNMSYCRFENTARDLDDCVDNWELDKNSSNDEIEAKKRIIELAKEIIEMENY